MLSLTVRRGMHARPDRLYKAVTEEWGVWFARPESVVMEPVVGKPFYFDVEFEGNRFPHYGRFLDLKPLHYVVLTWVTGPMGTKGAETVVTFDMHLDNAETLLTLTHTGFVDEESRERHAESWPHVLDQLDEKIR
jgi:uncharacterized protein YndB with AHSA1/START domain